jgi:predicted RNase H-like HicB family nuclease
VKQADRYVKLVEWSDQDQCFIGSCPELLYGGCHGEDPRAVFDELCQIVEETIVLYEQDGKRLPPALSGREFVNAMQKIG